MTCMATPRRKCRLADINHADVDLRDYSKVIIETIEQVIPGKNPKVFKKYFSTDVLTQSEAKSLMHRMIQQSKKYRLCWESEKSLLTVGFLPMGNY